MAYDAKLRALADTSRRALYESLVRMPGYTATLAEESRLSQPAVSQHLKVLLEAGLVSQQREGRRTLYMARRGALDELVSYLGGLATVPASAKPEVTNALEADAIASAALRWSREWPGQDPNVYAVTQRLLLMGRHVERALKETAERHGLQGSELLLLDAINLTAGHSLTPSQLQIRLGLTKGAVTKLMNNLERLGLICRSASQLDRRISHVALTPKAQSTLKTILDHHEYGADHAAAKRLPASGLTQLAHLLQHFHGLMEGELVRRAASDKSE